MDSRERRDGERGWHQDDIVCTRAYVMRLDASKLLMMDVKTLYKLYYREVMGEEMAKLGRMKDG